MLPWDEEWVKNPPVPGGMGAGKTRKICHFDQVEMRGGIMAIKESNFHTRNSLKG